MTITAELVKELRESTGVGMMDCKKALLETNGDLEAAVQWLRERGLAAASKKAGRDAKEGAIFTQSSGDNAVILELNCETDFVGNNDQFRALGQQLVAAILATPSVTLETLDSLSVSGKSYPDLISAAVLQLGENIGVKQFQTVNATGAFGEYVHSNGKIGVLVGFSGAIDAGIAKDIAMQVAASNPIYISSAEVPAEDKERESAIIRQQALNEGKPEKILENIVNGKLLKFYQETCLVEQVFIKDSEKRVRDLLPAGVQITAMTRYAIG